MSDWPKPAPVSWEIAFGDACERLFGRREIDTPEEYADVLMEAVDHVQRCAHDWPPHTREAIIAGLELIRANFIRRYAPQ